MKKKINIKILFILVTLTFCSAAIQAETYSKVTSAAQLIPGTSYLFVSEADQKANGDFGTNNLQSVNITLTNNTFICPENAVPFVLERVNQTWVFSKESVNLGTYSSGNNISLKGITGTSNSVKWLLTFDDFGQIAINNVAYPTCFIRYWQGNFMANIYSTPIALYRKDGIYSMAADAETDPVYWATFSDLNNATFFPSSEATVYKVVRNSNMVVSLTPLSTQTVGAVEGYVVPAGKGVMVRSTSTQVSYSTTSATSENNDTFFTDNLLHAANGAISQEAGHTYYKLAYATPGQGQSRDVTSLGFYYAVAGGAAYTPSAGKAYLDWDSSLGAPARFVLNEMEETETPTRIESLSSKEAPCKVLQNGQLFILVNGTCYSVTGQTLQNR